MLKWRRHVLTEQGSCKRTWNNKVAHMRAIFNHAIKYQLIATVITPFGWSS
ncbi:putative tyrosine recombinase xerC [Erwinia amylovora]|uniref:Tyrosine recombinase xerC n=1 Tax=Erwinia amylovora NBRC 12687 = CFBP 1232 TaxID=1219359 RepID=A0A830ZYP7_ERWAM|nr:putative tyrosine recombinase xerC [Erwinia amylovora ACW56400]QJQ55703.1 putative tyrosine recombinase xerC [Erwinia amylovora]CCO77426.1 Putative tyrosine recombinase xerC [Erwinia amylovora Ea356]CCO81210.1 Putative tyrosine recombinase xerC [Erwinia amylovora Ea266]CCO88799.1 Putative tyrosine recombinase xerC [Erwinia amylovora 01SFR-BO]CCO92557.1 Putative tyrosine recombinase xerC [Erwinia amylovora NBRC 12687 = CFBP 1232]CCO97909.1 Putative tyrosine recombinase xerC [Erwinia amylovo